MSVAVAVSVDISVAVALSVKVTLEKEGPCPITRANSSPPTAHRNGGQDDCSGAGISLGEVSGLGCSSDVYFDE